MISLSIKVDSKDVVAFLTKFPIEMKSSVALFKDRVGYKLDAESKRAAPAITGNLRRNIIYMNGALTAHAHYSKYVHGSPFYQNRMKRKETPFITSAITNSDTFIKDEARAMIERVIR